MNDRRSKTDQHLDAMVEFALGVQPVVADGRDKVEIELMRQVPLEFWEGMAAFVEGGVGERGKPARFRMH